MKNIVFTFEELGSDKASKKLSQVFAKAGANVVQATPSPKIQRTAGVTYRALDLTFADGQTVTLMVKQTGDIYQVKLNGAVLPIKNQDDHKAAVIEIIKAMESGRAKFQAKQAKTRAELPTGTKSVAPKIEATLKARISELDAEIATKQETVKSLQDELGAVMDAVGKGKKELLEIVIKENGKVIQRMSENDFLKMCRDSNIVRANGFLDDAIKVFNEKNPSGLVAERSWRKGVLDAAGWGEDSDNDEGAESDGNQDDTNYEPDDSQASLFDSITMAGDTYIQLNIGDEIINVSPSWFAESVGGKATDPGALLKMVNNWNAAQVRAASPNRATMMTVGAGASMPVLDSVRTNCDCGKTLDKCVSAKMDSGCKTMDKCGSKVMDKVCCDKCGLDSADCDCGEEKPFKREWAMA